MSTEDVAVVKLRGLLGSNRLVAGGEDVHLGEPVDDGEEDGVETGLR